MTLIIKKLAGNPALTPGRREMLDVVEKLHRDVRLKMIKIKRFEAKTENQGVLDSGATHAVRPICKEDDGLREISVELAGNVVTTMLINRTKTE